jgi:hypothetical protein
MHALRCEVTNHPRSIVQTKWECCWGVLVRYAGESSPDKLCHHISERKGKVT